jgi:hypothetical protein
LGTGVVIDPKAIVDTVSIYKEGVADSGHALYIAHTDKEGKVYYFAGYGWDKAQEIKSASDWQDYLTEFAADFKAKQVAPKL